ncbi:MAG: hypothetical protein IT410_02895 [Candidatus Doudnabacteria bacterium]|nr:hypothetical protein [Candidatus Doudnabacteria bacterium]
MNSLRHVLLYAIVILFISVIAAILYWLFGIQPINTVYGTIVVFVVCFLWLSWENFVISPRRIQIILQILAMDGGEMTTLEIIEQGKGELSRAAIHSELNYLIEKDLVSKRIEERTTPYIPLSYFKITPNGRREQHAKITSKLRLSWQRTWSQSGQTMSGLFLSSRFLTQTV